MATAQVTPMAAPGYGKRSAPDQGPRTARDFAHLPAREAAIAAYIDRLPDGAAMDAKTLAKQLAAYGQQAVRTALNNLARAGHLRRVQEPAAEGRTQWVTRTFFSRTPRDDQWWSTFLAGDTPKEVAERPQAGPSRAYRALAALGRSQPRLALSAAECAALAPLAEQWFQRGVGEGEFARLLGLGLPGEPIHCPGAFIRRRLIDKLPPEVSVPVSQARILECTGCGIPGTPQALSGGLCRTCHGEGPAAAMDPAHAAEIRHRVDRLRAVVRERRSAGGPGVR
ncbi:hypothetical protein [Streptomyces orinoci]|uniref:MarR family transcriptional regulator n=1 Tax=Streptomyces orinoci TaxID=67339 RepID=A0ABV3JRQ8_STRON|nr:hypothetical protein [Streptomyces orinoci]